MRILQIDRQPERFVQHPLGLVILVEIDMERACVLQKLHRQYRLIQIGREYQSRMHHVDGAIELSDLAVAGSQRVEDKTTMGVLLRHSARALQQRQVPLDRLRVFSLGIAGGGDPLRYQQNAGLEADPVIDLQRFSERDKRIIVARDQC